MAKRLALNPSPSRRELATLAGMWPARISMQLLKIASTSWNSSAENSQAPSSTLPTLPPSKATSIAAAALRSNSVVMPPFANPSPSDGACDFSMQACTLLRTERLNLG